ncbi:TetR/AcrR family transcriptional regulator [Leeia sp. TBRC 13508]|uniref:TetR/AcrR family transcriptional regulator n=1 Tax=Leeia speluncae TaxID=2884804 RepID=A0ABS8D395_9NEIS|nr:TetR/AcrR family transcriptional regulator [Leeia speluncae]MCB6182645.1 TetR/AcrR family transcriptional regulator [Leeia speluncae]
MSENTQKLNPVTALLLSAEEVFAQKGYEGATTGLIAQQAGIPKATLHYHFGTKETLYRQVLHSVFDEWHQAALKFDETNDPATAIEGYVRIKMAISRSRPLGSKIWAQEMIAGVPHLQDVLKNEVKPWFDSRTARIREWMEQGLIAKSNPDAIMFMIWAMTQHYADFETQIRVMTGQETLEKDWFDQITEDVVGLVLRAVGVK